MRKKALVIGVNYYGQSCELKGCINDAYNVRDFLVNERGFAPEDMVMLTDAPENYGTMMWPCFENMMNAFQWLVSNNGYGDVLWLSYSGHGGQTTDVYGARATGFDDTICPVDYATTGQIDSTTVWVFLYNWRLYGLWTSSADSCIKLHRALVSPMHPQARLTILFDCCHSGSACELPYVYRTDADGNVSIVDTLKRGAQLVSAAEGLVRGPFTPDKIADAKMLLGGAGSFFKSLQNIGTPSEDGLAEADMQWGSEMKDVWMFSGCADDQTSADTNIAGVATGAMSWAFINTMRQMQQPSYLDILTNTRGMLSNNYSQVPQLSCGGQYDLNQPLYL